MGLTVRVGDGTRLLTDDEGQAIARRLVAGESTKVIGDEYGRSTYWAWNVGRRYGARYVGNSTSGRWMWSDGQENDQKMPRRGHRLLPADQQAELVQYALAGILTRELTELFGVGRACIQRALHEEGLVFTGRNQFDGRWVRKEEETTVSDATQLTAEEEAARLEALLTPERGEAPEQQNGHTHVSARVDPADHEHFSAQLRESADLMEQAVTQLSERDARIEALEQNKTDNEESIARLSKALTEARAYAEHEHTDAESWRAYKAHLNARESQEESRRHDSVAARLKRALGAG